jgi:predicted protein tyrosine phosphatase
MMLVICPLADVERQAAQVRPARLVSLLSPQQAPPPTPIGVHHLVLQFHDVSEPSPGLVSPDAPMIARLLDFAGAWSEPAPMLVHCWMGVSRSPAAAMALAGALSPDRDERDIAQALRQASPTATPNPMIIALADRLLAREGRLIAAARGIGRGAETACGETFRFHVRPRR